MKNKAATPEPAPTGNGHVIVTELLKDVLARDEMGREKYGTSLKTDNGRDALMDAYQEALDLCFYLKQAIMEQDTTGPYELPNTGLKSDKPRYKQKFDLEPIPPCTCSCGNGGICAKEKDAQDEYLERLNSKSIS